MSRVEIWKRLLWKEFKEGYLIVLMLIVIPPIVFPIVKANHHSRREIWQIFGWIIALGLPLLVVLWAAVKAGRQRNGSEFVRSHLPIGAVDGWIASVVPPLIISAIAGVWYAGWTEEFIIGLGRNPNFAYNCGLYFSTCFVVAYVFSLVLSMLPAILVGLFCTFMGMAFVSSTSTSAEAAEFAAFFMRALIGATVCSLLFSALLNRIKLIANQVMCLGLLAVIVFAPFAVQKLFGPRQADFQEYQYDRSIQTSDGSIVVNAFAYSKAKNVTVVYRDFRNVSSISRTFKRNIEMIDIQDRRYVYLVQQAKGEKYVRLISWDTKTNSLQKVCTIPAGRNALFDSLRLSDYFSDEELAGKTHPDSHYLILALASGMGSGTDIWVIDLYKRKGVVVLPNVYPIRKLVRWDNHQALLLGCFDTARVDLKTMSASKVAFPIKDRGQR